MTKVLTRFILLAGLLIISGPLSCDKGRGVRKNPFENKLPDQSSGKEDPPFPWFAKSQPEQKAYLENRETLKNIFSQPSEDTISILQIENSRSLQMRALLQMNTDSFSLGIEIISSDEKIAVSVTNLSGETLSFTVFETRFKKDRKIEESFEPCVLAPGKIQIIEIPKADLGETFLYEVLFISEDRMIAKPILLFGPEIVDTL